MTSNGNTANTSGKQWTDSENVSPLELNPHFWLSDPDPSQYLLLYQMVQQLISKHKNNPVKFEEITLPGRSTRALKEHWAKIATGVTTAGISSQTSPGVPQVRAPRTPRGNKVKGKQAGKSINHLLQDTC
jgi:hypothetical protein